ncbi:reverse transcriptase domain, Reverse transcriptase zinc-binding domain protein [Artemisia annua]|uniref:Reverse transcriptase domain, Reverse transcriptase zinc-binding domain protein n=1 Tax=Artemisia annua TaxID=35608 RepID=A0A2U1PTM3_ARTAN|nr:reverse transcriptase domain, Reverse transcriptase zinc-binding domain protein [Artemisia annua]
MENSLIVEGEWAFKKMKCFMVNVYAPQEERKKNDLWNFIRNFMSQHQGNYFVFGDFNVVRSSSERIGSIFNHRSAFDFNEFINDCRFWDVPLGGHAFTRISSNGEKLSLFKDKMKHLKSNIKLWAHQFNAKKSEEKVQLSSKIADIERDLEAGLGSSSLHSQRKKMLLKLRDIEHAESLDVYQKAKIKWGIEADENTKFFHGIVNRKRRGLAIKGVMKDGTWFTDPGEIKDIFRDFFVEKFKHFKGVNVTRRSDHYKTLSPAQVSLLEHPTSELEVVLHSSFHSRTWEFRGSGSWSRIVGAINDMHDKGIIPHSSIKRQVKDGSTTRFWRDAWLGDIPFECQFPRLFCLEANKDCFVRDRWQNGWVWCWTRNFHGGVTGSQLDSLISMLENVQLSEGQDAWQWSLIGSNIFTVKDIRIFIDSISLPESPFETRWCRFIPRKINILVWRILRDRIPTRWNLSRKGFEVPSLLCPLCNTSPETSSHLFWSCNLAISVWRLVFKWMDLPLPDSDSLNGVFGWLDHARLNSASKSTLHSILGVVVWTLWQFRNNKIFGDKKMLQKDLLDQIVDVSFLWYSSRNRNCKVMIKHQVTFSYMDIES